MKAVRCRPGVGSALLVLLFCVAAPAAGQDGPLERVASLTDDGRTDEAREALQEWWDGRWDDARETERQRGLWLRATLTVDPTLARSDYTRLVLEHPGGSYSAAALLRLAQAADVEGRLSAAARHYERLLREYPNSPHRLEARRWLDEHREAGARARSASARTEERPDSAGPPPEEDGSRREGRVAIQLGAFSSMDRARTLLRTARDEGIEDVRLVRVGGSDLIRVRAGRFPTREAASALRSRVEDRGLEVTVVTDAERERPIP